LSDESDMPHIMWLNRNVTKERRDPGDLTQLLAAFLDFQGLGLKNWIKKRFVERFYGRRPHPFILALQHPSRPVLMGYVLEHQHFLRQWVKSLSWIVIKAARDDVVVMELDNIATEFLGYGQDRPSHYELLLQMGESLGLNRPAILGTAPLPGTSASIATWNEIGEKRHWLEITAAMHSLELVASRTIVDDGARMPYFDPAILHSDEVTEATKAFLREGCEADVGHSEVPLGLVDAEAAKLGLVDDVQTTFLRSIDSFDRYLMARLERAAQYDPTVLSYTRVR
jgi:pyrroloquinoline-quinone synthase